MLHPHEEMSEMERISRSEKRMIGELIELSRSVADDFGVEERFSRRLAIDSGNGRRVITSAVISPDFLKYLLGSLGGQALPIGNLLKLAPAALLAALVGVGVGGERLTNWVKRKTGIDPQAGLPWMVNENNMKDPVWDEAHGSRHIKDIPSYAEIPSAKLMPEYDEARNLEEDSLRDAVGFPDEYETSGGSGQELRRRYMRPRDLGSDPFVPGGAAYSPMDEVSAERMPRSSSGGHKFKKVAQLFTTPFGEHIVNAPEKSPFLGFIAPGDQETLTSVFADRPGTITPINQISPRVLSPEEGARYAPQGGLPMWGAGGTPKEAALLRLQALSDPRYSVPAMTAGLEAQYYQVLTQLRGGQISPQTAGYLLDRLSGVMIDSGVDPMMVDRIREDAISRLMFGGGGYGERGGEGWVDAPYGEERIEGPFDSGRETLFRNIEDTRGRMEDIAERSGMGGAAVQQNPMVSGIEMMNP